jgi:hypothetical protein
MKSKMTSMNDPQKKNLKKRKSMNFPIKTISALAIGGFVTGTALAGPNDAYAAGFASRPLYETKPVGIALFRSTRLTSDFPNRIVVKEESKLVPTGQPKNPGMMELDTGYEVTSW